MAKAGHGRVPRALVWVLSALALVPAATAQQSPTLRAPQLRIPGELTGSDPVDGRRAGCHHKVHTATLTADTQYVIDLIDRGLGNMDPWVRLEDSTGAVLAEDDDGGGNLNARIVFTPTKTGTYRIVVTTCSPGRTGSYLLQVVDLLPGETPPRQGQASPVPTVFGDVLVKPDSWPRGFSGSASEDRPGYGEYRFLVQNRSPTAQHRITLTLPRESGAFPRGDYLRSLKRTVDLPPGATKTVALFQPNLSLAAHARQAQVEIDGQVQQGGIPISIAVDRGPLPWGHAGQARTPAFLILAPHTLATSLSQHVFKSAVGQPVRQVSGGYSSTSGVYMGPGMHNGQQYTYIQVHHFPQAPSRLAFWSDHWLAYTDYAGVVVAGPDLDKAPPEVRSVLWRYVECGGALLVVGPCTLPGSWARTRAELRGVTSYHPGFGRCLVSKDAAVEGWEPEVWWAITAMWEQSGRLMDQVCTPGEANRRFPVAESGAMSVRALFLFLVPAVLLIGPVNLYLLARRKRLIWMLWTVPALSLAACAALVAYLALGEGWHGGVRAEVVTFLDETSGRGSTVGWAGFYTPLTPADGLHFSADTQLVPHLARRSPGHSRRGRARSMDWTDGQHLDSGWLTARVPAHFLICKSELRPERVRVRPGEGGALTLVNELAAPIHSIWVADRQGKLYSAGPIPAGGAARLTPSSDPTRADGKPEALRDGYTGDWLRFSAALAQEPANYLRPGCYLAVLEDSPFLEQGLPQAQRQARSVVYGVMKEPL